MLSPPVTETPAIGTPDTLNEIIRGFTPEMLDDIDWERDRDEIGTMISQMLPVESLVPDIYKDWRPVVRDAVAYVGSHLSPGRLAPKLLEQMELLAPWRLFGVI